MEQLEGSRYAKLREVVHTIQDEARSSLIKASRKAPQSRAVTLNTPKFVFFEEKMVRLVAEQDGDVQWVLKDEGEAWLKSKAARTRH